MLSAILYDSDFSTISQWMWWKLQTRNVAPQKDIENFMDEESKKESSLPEKDNSKNTYAEIQ